MVESELFRGRRLIISVPTTRQSEFRRWKFSKTYQAVKAKIKSRACSGLLVQTRRPPRTPHEYARENSTLRVSCSLNDPTHMDGEWKKRNRCLHCKYVPNNMKCFGVGVWVYYWVSALVPLVSYFSLLKNNDRLEVERQATRRQVGSYRAAHRSDPTRYIDLASSVTCSTPCLHWHAFVYRLTKHRVWTERVNTS